MLKSTQRLSREQFSQVFKHGVVHHTPHFLIRTLSSTTEDHSRASVVVSKKVHKGAIGRHLLRRRLYSVLRPLLKDFEEHQDLIVIAKKGAPTLSFEQIAAELAHLK